MTVANRTRRRLTSIIASAAMISTALAPGAHAQISGGAGISGPYASSPPAITSVVCDTKCAGLDKVKKGSLLQISGLRLASARRVTFTGRSGKRDDVTATVISRTETTATVLTPARAKSGRLRIVNGDGNKSRPSAMKVKVVKSSVVGKDLEARVEGRKTYVFDGVSKPALRYFVGARGAAQVQITLARKGDPVALATWTGTSIPAGSVRAVSWDGRIGGVQAPDGAYEFRVRAVGSNNARSARTSGSSATAAFSVLSYAFPIVGEHKFGTGAGSFGAGRKDSSHQGQDIFAKCGTPLVAARGGVVVKAGVQARAGNYVVIDTEGDTNDHVYMHLIARPLVATGARVATRQPLGEVGQTGAASGCHLHFEAWPGGWQKGSPIDPKPMLKSWDK